MSLSLGPYEQKGISWVWLCAQTEGWRGALHSHHSGTKYIVQRKGLREESSKKIKVNEKNQEENQNLSTEIRRQKHHDMLLKKGLKNHKWMLNYLALILVLLWGSANNINLRGAEAEHVVNRDVLHGAISRVDLNVTLVREEIISLRCVWHFDAAQPKATTLWACKRATQRWEIERSHAWLERFTAQSMSEWWFVPRGVPPGWGSGGRWSFVAGDHEPGLQRRRSCHGENCAARARTPRAASAYQGDLWCRWSGIPGPANVCMQIHNIKHASKLLILISSTYESSSHACTYTHTFRGCYHLPDDINSSGPDLGVAAHDGHTGSKRAINAEDHTLHCPWQHSQVGLCTCLIPSWDRKREIAWKT